MPTAQIDEDDVGKTVVNASGESVGTISAVNDDTPYVDLEKGMHKEETAALRWNDISDEDGYPLDEHAVDRITDDEVQLTSGR